MKRIRTAQNSLFRGSKRPTGCASIFALLAMVASSSQAALPFSSISGDRGAAENECQSLAGQQFDMATVQGAERLIKGHVIASGDTKGATVEADMCRVRLRLQPTTSSDIWAEVWLPEVWNKKLYFVGGAGFDGALSAGGASQMNSVLQRGYAAVATDVGHKPAPSVGQWAHGQPEKVTDFGHRANHLVAVATKQVIARHYGSAAKRSYFVGCSNGGREAMMEATRYPDDFDGIVAGAPAMRYVEVLTQLSWFHKVVHGPGGAPTLGSKLGLVNRAVLDKCDTLDQVSDGILENPSICKFDPAELRCTEQSDAAHCLTDAEVTAFRKIYDGPRLSNGTHVFNGPVPGSEEGPATWAGWIVPERTATFVQDFYGWLVYDDPNWKFENYDMDRDYPVALERLGPIVNSNNPDLSAFARSDGKLIIYHGWYDPGITPSETVRYYEEVSRLLGPQADDHVRLFMVPGMAHCADGPGATNFDMLTALENWSENGQAPDQVVAERPKSDPPFTRPLCPWPKTAHYDGTGSTSDAGSFSCK